MERIVILIPSLNPDEHLLKLLGKLKQTGIEDIIVIDDGSEESCSGVFRQVKALGCLTVSHFENRGKGAALKTGIRCAIQKFGKGNAYITADADGQHLPEDICRVAQTLQQHPDSLILGVREFHRKEVPWKSRWGNQITSVFFRLTNGISCPDTQTGLRGIPPCLEQLALLEEGERYEYEMNFLVDAVKKCHCISYLLQRFMRMETGLPISAQ